MAENKMSDMIRASLDGIRTFAGTDTFVGEPIPTPQGVTVIPFCRVTMALATGGVDYNAHKLSPPDFGGGGGTGVTVTPIALLTVDPAGEVKVVPLSQSKSADALDRAISFLQDAPAWIQKIRGAFS